MMMPWMVVVLMMTWGIADAQHLPSGHPPSEQRAKVVTTTSQLQHLDKKIIALKQQLEHAQGRQNGIEQVLAVQDKKMSDVVRGLNHSAQIMHKNKLKIAQLTQNVSQLSTQLQAQQAVLSKHLYARYRMGKTGVLKGLLYVESPMQLHQWVTFFQYVVASRTRAIEKIIQTQQQLRALQATLKQELSMMTEQQAHLQQNQKQLEEEKATQLVVMNSLMQHIKTNQQALSDYEKDKENLARVLQTLIHQQVAEPLEPVVSQKPSTSMSPIDGKIYSTRRWNQGLLLSANEGQAVKAVRAGKVVFSDWLRGYGLLIIVDHGQGMMTLYGYNQSLFKHQGEFVHAGQQIATVGHSGGRREDALYFEVRRRGKVVSANSFL